MKKKPTVHVKVRRHLIKELINAWNERSWILSAYSGKEQCHGIQTGIVQVARYSTSKLNKDHNIHESVIYSWYLNI